jgi:hypothetical protein
MSNATVHPIFAKPEEAIVPEVVDTSQELHMSAEELQTLTNRLEHFAGQGVIFGLDEQGNVEFSLDESLPRGVTVLVEQFKAKTLWMAILRSVLEEAVESEKENL